MNLENISQEAIRAEQARFMTKVYGWMSGALILTGVIAAWVANTEQIVNVIFSNRFYFYGLLILEFAAVAYLSAAINKLSAKAAIGLFLGYSALNGLTFSVIFLAFTASSIATTFYITAGTFGAMSLYGYYTKTDLTSIGNIAFMALIGLIIASVVNFFFQNEMLYWIVTYAGVLIFVALTAYDTQKIKRLNIIGNEGTEEDQKEALMGALTLYLDFINLFLFLLRIFGRRK
ncbi:Bax inhibitor-1/YccA family protein [Galbibacter mesophilus]|uniref:Bax inhibitor-1/YccA family protein n=1 Tax=Galbibacter mesophilus TaxID=379069 RepID=UPI00191DE2AC|nr:Bax inhibitor-1/YccA family protein [Galbibacter mesophilus]MCM5662071.1 Bax inhibitor-1/YccA family protein [Galbibacter mesophilus]